MSSDLTYGIENRGEFYSHHYLDALLEGDLKPLLKAWADAEKGTPPRRPPSKALNGLAGAYFQARADASDLGEHAPEPAWRIAHALHARLLDALGYHREPAAVALEDGTTLPLLHEVRRGGKAYLWILESPFPAETDGDPMDHAPLRAQLPPGHDDVDLPALSWRELLDTRVFREEDAPTWVLFLGGSEAVLTHAFKWPRGQAIAFNLDALYARRQSTAFRAMAGLLHADALCPAEGTPLHEQLDENSHKHAFAVSTDLREGAQQAIELLGNEAIRFLREERKKGVFGTSDSAEAVDPKQLTRECLLWLYRLIFLFYVESRSEELGVAPMKSTAYRMGYSLESLRALETVPLTTPQAQHGTYIDASLRQLFRLVNDGHPKDQQLALAAGVDAVAFRIHGLKSRLFDDAETPILGKVRFRNAVLQRVIELLSLSREGKHRSRGRISYASLGINQLGSVYEGLLSYSGFFATEDLIEVANAKENGKPDARTFFVPARDRELYEDDELVRDETGARRQYPKGTYLFRLAGRDREKSASYYTPEVLTRCLVKYTLRERIGVNEDDPNWVTADEILDLTVCEPAMGSGAFLNEVVNQLSEAHLERKQAELRKLDPEHPGIPADRYLRELQRVKARIAANQCYGVDLNPLAAELGKVSLWLNVLRTGAPAPFFDARIATGNSLVGARRATYDASLLHKSSKKDGPGWLDRAPEPVERQRPVGAVYHFLVPASGMAAFDGDKVVKQLLPDEVATISAWRKSLNASWSEADKTRLEHLSAVVDRLWAEHAANREAALAECDQRHPVWPEPEPPSGIRQDEDHLARAWATQVVRNAAGRRLRAAMDLWSALWFWPVREAGLLPSRQEWLEDLELLLLAKPRVDLNEAADRQARRLHLLAELVATRGFHHWEWAFPEVFERGGFDIIVGNPPWVKLQWNEGAILSDLDPRLEIRRMSAKQKAGARASTLSEDASLDAYLGEYQELDGAKAFLNSGANYQLLKGVQTNLYKAFILQSWALSRANAAAGMVHQYGIFDDPKGGALRAELYSRLAITVTFQNQLKLFEDVQNEKRYTISVFRGHAQTVSFQGLANAFHPRTLDESLAHDGSGEVPAIKTQDGTWDLRGHASRIVRVDEDALALFAALYDSPETPFGEARLPVVHSAEVLEVLKRLSRAKSLGESGVLYGTTREWNEGDRVKDGTLVRHQWTPSSPSDVVLSGPHIFVGNPLFKTPRVPCQHNKDYDVIDHAAISLSFLPGTLFKHAGASAPKPVPTFRGQPIFQHFRHIHRQMAPPTGSRTLAAAISAAGTQNIHGVFGLAFADLRDMVNYNSLAASLVVDFFVKSTGSANIILSIAEKFPLTTSGVEWRTPRTLRLNCLTVHYADLWSELYEPKFQIDAHTKPDARLDDWSQLGPKWTRDTPLRSPFARRQALVELDALAALALQLTADELCLIYRIQFPILQQYEADTWYDRRGRIVFTNNRGLPGVGLARKQWEEIRGDQLDAQTYAGINPLPDWAHDALGTYEPPFDRCDREADMRQAYTEFVRRGVGSSNG